MLCVAWLGVSANADPTTPGAAAQAADAAAQAAGAATQAAGAPATPAATPAATAAGAGTPGTPGPAIPAEKAAATPVSQLPEIEIQRDEPKFVAPTRRDRIGRIWAPVMISGKGPYRLVLDTGASHSAVTQRTADKLGLPLTGELTLLTGVTGSATVQALSVDRMEVGELLLGPTFLPIVPDVFGGADGVLGREGLAGMRISADFGRDRLTITRSHNQHAGFGFSVVPLKVTPEGLLVATAVVGRVAARAIIDTGAQRTVGNEALRVAVLRHSDPRGHPEGIMGVTLDVQEGDNEPTPPIFLDKVTLAGVRVTYGDMFLFEHWHMIKEPTLLIGMDVLGSFDIVVIDYRTHQLELLLRQSQLPDIVNRPVAPGEYKPF
jgi:predicted aspartyl protease